MCVCVSVCVCVCVCEEERMCGFRLCLVVTYAPALNKINYCCGGVHLHAEQCQASPRIALCRWWGVCALRVWCSQR